MLMAGARIGEILVPQCQQRLVRRSVDLDRYQGRRRTGEGVFPDPGINEAPGRCYIEKLAADCKAFTAADPAHFDAVSSPGAQINRDLPSDPARRTPPFAQCCGPGPGAENAMRRGAEPPLQRDSRFRRSYSGRSAFDGGSHLLSSLSR